MTPEKREHGEDRLRNESDGRKNEAKRMEWCYVIVRGANCADRVMAKGTWKYSLSLTTTHDDMLRRRGVDSKSEFGSALPLSHKVCRLLVRTPAATPFRSPLWLLMSG